jgi:Fe-S-cluster containining protein
VTNVEIAALAEELGMEVERFEREYVRKIGVRKSLKEYRNGDCYLFDGTTRKCTVYESRPRQCRTWPFWDSNIRTPEAWAATCEVCPGSGAGKLYQLEEIESQRQVIRL